MVYMIGWINNIWNSIEEICNFSGIWLTQHTGGYSIIIKTRQKIILIKVTDV